MRTVRIVERGLVFLASATLLAACGKMSFGQTSGAMNSPPRLLISSSRPATNRAIALDKVVREIDDPNTGGHWVLARDLEHPQGPGRLFLLANLGDRAESSHLGGLSGVIPEFNPALLRPVIRTGDRVVVEENTPVAEARLEAVALGPAAKGSAFNVRLRIGGKVERAVALSPGRAAFYVDVKVSP